MIWMGLSANGVYLPGKRREPDDERVGRMGYAVFRQTNPWTNVSKPDVFEGSKG